MGFLIGPYLNYLFVYINDEREWNIMGRKWNNIKEKKRQKMLILVGFMLSSDGKYM